MKLNLALVLPLSHRASLDQDSKGWTSVGVPPLGTCAMEHLFFVGFCFLGFFV